MRIWRVIASIAAASPIMVSEGNASSYLNLHEPPARVWPEARVISLARLEAHRHRGRRCLSWYKASAPATATLQWCTRAEVEICHITCCLLLRSGTATSCISKQPASYIPSYGNRKVSMATASISHLPKILVMFQQSEVVSLIPKSV